MKTEENHTHYFKSVQLIIGAADVWQCDCGDIRKKVVW